MRIGINVPNELLRQVKAIRPEVNVSQVCRDALEERAKVAQRSTQQACADGMDAVAARLDPEPPLEPDWEAYAMEDAREWMNAHTPDTWKRFMYEADYLRKQGRDEAEMVNSWSGNTAGRNKGLGARLWEHQDWFIAQLEIEEITGMPTNARKRATEAYSRAWLGYANAVRLLYEKRREAIIREWLAERAEYRRRLPKPELPPQLDESLSGGGS